jgi:hypothetical protein
MAPQPQALVASPKPGRASLPRMIGRWPHTPIPYPHPVSRPVGAVPLRQRGAGRASLLADEKPIDVFVDGRAGLDLYGFVKQREDRKQGVPHL